MANVTVEIESPARAAGENRPNVWVLFPTYHGERERFNGYCEDNPGCECTDVVDDCTQRLCRGKRLCRKLPPVSAVFVEHARAFATALAAKRELSSSPVANVRASVFYDDCWPGRGRCQGKRPCLEPGDQMLSCRATAMLCASGTWEHALSKAKAWTPPPPHRR